MQSLEALKQKKDVTNDLKGVVKTMKALAAVSIRQFEQAVASLSGYASTVHAGLHILMINRPEGFLTRQHAPDGPIRIGAVVLGSERGMCGQFNQRVVDFASTHLNEQTVERILVIGERAGHLLESRSRPVTGLPLPGALSEFPHAIQQILATVERWQVGRHVDRILVFHNQPTRAAGYRPRQNQLYPVDREWLAHLTAEPWHTRQVPLACGDWHALFSALIRQYFFVSLYRALAESLAAENASRLAAMQAAEQNIQQQLDEITTLYNQQRQASITGELLDVVSGFEALTGT